MTDQEKFSLIASEVTELARLQSELAAWRQIRPVLGGSNIYHLADDKVIELEKEIEATLSNIKSMRDRL